jgi:hypothetical protein
MEEVIIGLNSKLINGETARQGPRKPSQENAMGEILFL